MTYEISDAERVAAWRLYVQLKTRKAALPFDAEHDLVAEVLDSLYELVDITRDLLTGLPVRGSDSAGLADLMLRVLNDGLRPFLTEWQADFRRWWAKAIHDTATQDEHPQIVQKSYPQYETLVESLLEMNHHLDQYADDLLVVARSQPRFLIPRKRPRATAPSEIDDSSS